MRLSVTPAGRTASDERGAVAIVVALSMVMLLVTAAMVLDFGVVRVDRQRAKSTADSAVMAGMRAADGKTGDVYSFPGSLRRPVVPARQRRPDVGAARRHLRLP